MHSVYFYFKIMKFKRLLYFLKFHIKSKPNKPMETRRIIKFPKVITPYILFYMRWYFNVHDIIKNMLFNA